MRRLNRYVEEQAPWQLAKDPARAEDLDRVLRTLVEGLRVLTVLLHPWLPLTSVKLLETLGAPDLSLSGARLGAGSAGRGGAPGPALPQAAAPGRGGVIDSHTHLSSCAEPDAELVAEAARAGVRRILTVGMDGPSCREALWAARELDGVRAAIGRHPNHATGFGDDDADELAELAAGGRELVAAVGETGLDFFRDTAPRARPGARLPRPARARPRPGQAGRHPHARGGGGDARDAPRPRRRPRRRAALLLDARPPRRVPRARLVDLLRRERDLPGQRRARRRRRARPRRPPARRDRRAVPHAAAGPQGAQPPRAGAPHRPLPGRAPRPGTRGARGGRSSATARGSSAGERDARRPDPAQPAPPAPVRRAPEARPRPELPRRLEHPRRHRACRRADARRTSCSRSAAASASSASTSRPGRRTSTWWRSTPRSCPRCATRSTPTRTRRSTSPTRWRSTSRRSTPRRRRSSPTCPTASRPARSCARSRSCPP